MQPTPSNRPAPDPSTATQHLKEAHTLLQSLRERLDRHPELEQAIEKLEEALNLLTVKTGGML
jgi:predicted translin family RNA/ssDNA-binding protein